MNMRVPVSNLLLLASLHLICIRTSTAKEQFTFRQKLHDLVEYKRSIATSSESSANNLIYSRSSQEIAQSVFKRLYREIMHDKNSVDIVILLDSSDRMGVEGTNTARKFIARLISMMPQEKFWDGSIKVAMLSYALSQNVTLQFDFSWEKGIYREMVRKAVRRTAYIGGYENHGAIAMWWAESIFLKSRRTNDSETAKVLLYATNGHITDQDLMFGRVDAVSVVSNYLKNKGYKLFTVVPGTNVVRSTINEIASSPKSDYIIPVVNYHAGESIYTKLKAEIRRAHHRRNTS